MIRVRAGGRPSRRFLIVVTLWFERSPAMSISPNAPTVDYFFSLLSPYAYLGHAALLAVMREAGATPRYRPVRIFEFFAANGGLPLGQRAPARQRYRLVELRRWRERRGLPL